MGADATRLTFLLCAASDVSTWLQHRVVGANPFYDNSPRWFSALLTAFAISRLQSSADIRDVVFSGPSCLAWNSSVFELTSSAG
jgi:hypothetical protein